MENIQGAFDICLELPTPDKEIEGRENLGVSELYFCSDETYLAASYAILSVQMRQLLAR